VVDIPVEDECTNMSFLVLGIHNLIISPGFLKLKTRRGFKVHLVQCFQLIGEETKVQRG
jgi:hypothetical protein